MFGGEGVLVFTHVILGGSRMIIGRGIPIMPGESASGFRRPSRHCIVEEEGRGVYLCHAWPWSYEYRGEGGGEDLRVGRVEVEEGGGGGKGRGSKFHADCLLEESKTEKALRSDGRTTHRGGAGTTKLQLVG